MILIIKRIFFCIMILIYFFLFVVIISNVISFFKIDISKYEVVSNKIPKEFDGFKILQLSDLHNRRFSKKLIKKIHSQDPDIIVITGDMVSANSKGFNGFFDVIKGLDNKYPIYYVFGNHEQRLSLEKRALIVSRLKEYGVKVINNDADYIIKGKDYIKIYGLHQNLLYYNNYIKSKKSYSYDKKDIETIFPGLDDKTFNILITHNPLYFETYEKWGTDLIFSGHVHGGIVRIPFIGGLLSPERNFFPKYSGGEYSINDSKMIVSRGLGYSTVNLRVFNNPEICVVELKSE